MTYSKGFTFIEVLVVTGLFILIAAILSSSFFAILSGSSKATITAEVKQNSEYALSVMEQTIRNAKPTPVCTPDNLSVTITNPDSSITIFSCVLTGLSPHIAINNNALTSSSVRLTACNFSCLEALPTSPAGVRITFTLAQMGSTNLRPQEKSTQSFQTTVYQRNY